MSKARTLPRVMVVTELNSEFRRMMFDGIVRYLREHAVPPFTMEWTESLPYPGDDNGDIDGVLTSEFPLPRWSSSVPTVVIGGAESKVALPRVMPDHRMAGQLGFDHLIERGYSEVAFLGVRDVAYAQARQAGFLAAARRHRREVHLLEVSNTQSMRKDRVRGLKRLRQWLRQLPVSVGIMACQDHWARDVVQAAVAEGLRLPHDVGVVGADNNELICESMYPPLSSVHMNFASVGYKAGQLLGRMLSGRSPRQHVARVRPRGVVARLSTDLLAVQDPEVVAAIRYIQERTDESLLIDEIAEAVGISRRGLERRFRRCLGHSPYQQIQHQRIERAKHMLVNTNRSVTQIAYDCGFGHAPNMSTTFHRLVGVTPRAYRQQHSVE